MKPEVTFRTSCERLEEILDGDVRSRILAEASISSLGDAFRANAFPSVPLQRIVGRLDARTREDGFHVLHDWDGKADKLNEETIPVEVARFAADNCGPVPPPIVLAILLDYYFLYVVALLALRAWDEGDANENLDRVSRLLGALQGGSGSGQRFVDEAETLILVAVSHFEPDVRAYDRLLEKVKSLDEDHRTNLALAHAAILASHLRFGFEATYGRDIVEMRKDNAPDYPWLLAALGTLMTRYARMVEENVRGSERDRIVEALLNALTPDPRAFVGKPPASLTSSEGELTRFRELFEKHREGLLEEFERHRPSEEAYSPVSFFFNFPHNLLKGVVIDALLRGEPWRLSLNDLLTGIPRGGPESESRTNLARTMMDYARKSPDRIRGRLTPVIVYDVRAGRRAFTDTLKRLRD
ncbi:MAG TPA: hypothetical protein VIE88_02635 [Vicinamibacteria bacterium]